MMIIALFSDLL